MNIAVILLIPLMSLFASTVMTYIALATPIGPWIAPTIVLLVSSLIRLTRNYEKQTSIIALTTAGSSIGGILATACAFSLPTLYFLDKALFNAWLAQPWYFIGLVAWLSLAAGSFGYIIANMVEKQLLVEQDMPFPIGQLVYKMIAAQNQVRKTGELVVGFIASLFFCIAQGGLFGMRSLLPSTVSLLSSATFGVVTIPALTVRLDMLPMLLAIGFISGYLIAVPLLVGTVAKIILIDPFNRVLFPDISGSDFVLAFCSGMVVSGAAQSFLEFPAFIQWVRTAWSRRTTSGAFAHVRTNTTVSELIITAILVVSFLTYCKLSFFAQVYLIIGTALCTYQIVVIAGKIGLAQLGRFATFVMVPAMFLFGATPLLLTVMATFVEIAGGVATDILFGRKMGYLAHTDMQQLRRAQLFGLVVSSVCVGAVMWLLATHFGLGSAELFAQRAQARALLINVRSFNLLVLLIGAVFGVLLKLVKMNPMLVLGGILMPLPFSLGLMIGGLLALLTKNRHEWESFWSGVFAANSIAELLKTIF